MFKNIIKFILAVAVIVASIAGVSYYNKIQNQNNNLISNKPEFITEKDPNLAEEDRIIFEERLASAEEKIKNLSEQVTGEEKYYLYMQAGNQKLLLGKLSEAKEYFISASNLMPTYFVAYNALYETYVIMTDYDSARNSIDKALSLVSNNADLWRKKIQLEKEKFGATNEQLEQYYSEALDKTNSSVDILTVYAQFLESTGDLKGAIEQWKKAIDSYPQGKDLYQAEITRLEGMVK